MKRLYNLTAADLTAWRQERMRVGQQRYGDRDSGRYNLVDVVEELLDVLNILERFENRARAQGYGFSELQKILLGITKEKAEVLIGLVQSFDKGIPDDLCTDENGGERIWWPGEG